MAKAVTYNILCLVFIFFGLTKCQKMNISVNSTTGICLGGNFKNVVDLKQNIQGCVIILGYLELAFGARNNFTNIQFNTLREITDYLVIYNAIGLESVGQLFPALTRIRGNKLLFHNYALIIHNNPNLREIALFNLVKIDRGGVVIWGSPQACYVNTIDWKVLTPNGRHVIGASEKPVECSIPCTCALYEPKNRCWNNKKCQIFIEDQHCDEQCLGCRITNNTECFTCRNYTHKFQCFSECPSGTIIQPDSLYCVTKEECHEFGGFVWNNTCIYECPRYYVLSNNTVHRTCEPSSRREMNCSHLTIQYLGAIQTAENCVYVNGSLIIRLRYVLDAMDQLKKYLNKIEEVSDFILVESSDVITSLDFLSSLRVIKGNVLKDHKYSLYIYNNNNLQTLFSPEVTKNLQIKNGTAWFQRNPVLCTNLIEEMKSKFPNAPSDLDIPIGSNGYQGGCKEVQFNFSITVDTDTSVKITFPIKDYNDTHYTALYARLKPGVRSKVVPENCCEFEWRDVDITTISGKRFSIVEIKDLVPASTYAFCVEIFNPEKKQLSRTNIVNFTTPIGTPEPPFIIELVAYSPNVVVLHWTNHKNYIEHIKGYELDVELLEMSPRQSMVDYCRYKDDFFEDDDIRHAIVRKPPPAYKKDCESMCGILSTVPPGVMAEEYFDVCDENFKCNHTEDSITTNSSIKNYVRTLALKLDGPRKNFQVGGLAPFSDYKFRLRACVGRQCSRSARGIVRTYRSKYADIISNVSGHADGLGTVTVKWKAPEVTNGPILSYSVEVLPRVNMTNILPHVVCVRANETKIVVKSVIISEYLVKVCLKTLASSRNCSDWVSVPAPVPLAPPTMRHSTISKMNILWAGTLCGILTYIATFFAIWLKSQRRMHGDTVPLVDSRASYRVESDAPALMLSDFVPFHTMSLE